MRKQPIPESSAQPPAGAPRRGVVDFDVPPPTPLPRHKGEAQVELDALDDTAERIRKEVMDVFESWVLAREDNKRALKPSSLKVYRARAAVIARFLGDARRSIATLDEDLLVRFTASLEDSKVHRRYLDLLDELCVHEAVACRGAVADRVVARFVAKGKREGTIELEPRYTLTTISPSARAAYIAWFQKPMASGDWTDHRDRALCAVMLGAGLKPGEALSLDLEWLAYDTAADEANGIAWKICVPANGQFAERDTPLADYARQCLGDWIRAGRRLGVVGMAHGLVFPSLDHVSRMDDTTFLLRFKKIREELGLPHHTPHALRNTWAVANLEGADAAKVERIRLSLGLAEPEGILPFQRALATAKGMAFK